ncbi:MAG: hypothetical protein AB7O24_24110 [Kofleriaceae bacterium]
MIRAWLVFAPLAAAIAGGCSGDGRARPRSEPPRIASRPAADPAVGMVTELDGISPVFGEAVLAELTGDESAARAGFERLLAAPETSSSLAARAALHLASLESRRGKSRHALDLVARAEALAPTDAVIREGVVQLRVDSVAAQRQVDLRGPRVGTPLRGVQPAVADAFAAAERGISTVHKLRRRPPIESLVRSVRAMERATEALVARYHAVSKHGGVALVAARYRAGSLYHDLALALLFELPPELDANVASEIRRTLRARAFAYLRKAVAEYKASLTAPLNVDAELWRLAAETDLGGAEKILDAAD